MKKSLLTLSLLAGTILNGSAQSHVINDTNPIESQKPKSEHEVTLTHGHPTEMPMLPTASSAAVNAYQVLDSVYFWGWDVALSNWRSVPQLRTIDIVYDSDYNNLGDTRQNMFGTEWKNYDKKIRTFNASGQLTNALYQSWSSTWTNSSQTNYAYDGNGNETERIEQLWENNAWKNYTKVTSGYDGDDNLISAIYQKAVGSTWENTTRYTYTVDANGNVTTHLYENWDGSAWENAERNTSTYNGDNNKTYNLNEVWGNNAWADYGQTVFYYDQNGVLDSILHQAWQNNAWVDSYRYQYAYGLNDNSSTATYQNWDGNAWVTATVFGTLYDEDDFLVYETTKIYSEGSVVYGDSTYYYFGTVSGINEFDGANEILVYPNPSNGQMQITLPSTFAGASYAIYNSTGTQISAGAIQSTSQSIDIVGYATGIYTLRMQTDKGIFTKRLMKH